MLWQDGDENVLPIHGVDQGVGGLDAGGQPGQPPRCDNDSSLVEHTGEDDQHVVNADGVVIFRDIALETNRGGKILYLTIDS